MGHVREFFRAVGGKWFLLPGIVSGCIAFLTLLQGFGVTIIPEVSVWAMAFFAIVPISAWAIAGLLHRVVELDRKITALEASSGPLIRLSEAAVAKQNISSGTSHKESVGVSITNISPRSLVGCLAKVEEVISPVPIERLNLPRAVQTLHQTEGSGRFDLRKGETKTIVVASRILDLSMIPPLILEFEGGQRQKCGLNQELRIRLCVYTDGDPVTQWVHVRKQGLSLVAVLYDP
jgi:hypothetical protein